jgi:hypothetical protein
MAAIVSVIAVVLISMLINRFATIALSLTGMSREEARFQARAAMSGVGLTTRRPDDIVAHPSPNSTSANVDRAVTRLTPKRPPSEGSRGDRAAGVSRSAAAAYRRDQIAESPPLRARGLPMLPGCSTPNPCCGRPGARW